MVRFKSFAFIALALIFSPELAAERVSVCVSVSNEDGCPVENAAIVVSTQRDPLVLSWSGTIKQRVERFETDSTGVGRCSLICHSGDFKLKVEAAGYYSEVIDDLSFSTDSGEKAMSMRFLEKAKNIQVRLRRVKNPVKLLKVAPVTGWKIPSRSGRYGFDLALGDWVAPLGAGKVPDLMVLCEDFQMEPYHLRGCLEFPAGGAYVMKKVVSSSFVSCYSADTNAVYVSSFPFEYRVEPDGARMMMPVVGKEDYLVFRIRERRDDKGRLISAHYGKIYGPIRTSGVFKFESAYLNDVVNDNNLECDER